MTPTERLPVGVCVVLVETQPERLVITVTTNRNVDRNLYSARPEPRQQFSEPEAVIEAVVKFLRHFERQESR